MTINTNIHPILYINEKEDFISQKIIPMDYNHGIKCVFSHKEKNSKLVEILTVEIIRQLIFYGRGFY
jgi:hypothetical protein